MVCLGDLEPSNGRGRRGQGGLLGAELQIRSAPDAEFKSEADNRAYSEPNSTSKTDVLAIVRALDSGGQIRVN